MSDTPNQPDGDKQPEGKEQERTFTQADMDDLAKKIRAEERRKASEKFADYDDLKVRAEGAKSAEERLADLEKQVQAANREALRRRVQAAHGIADEDADLFLTGADEETLTAQAKRLAARESERKSNGNHVPAEGNNPRSQGDEMQSFTRQLFGRVEG